MKITTAGPTAPHDHGAGRTRRGMRIAAMAAGALLATGSVLGGALSASADTIDDGIDDITVEVLPQNGDDVSTATAPEPEPERAPVPAPQPQPQPQPSSIVAPAAPLVPAAGRDAGVVDVGNAGTDFFVEPHPARADGADAIRVAVRLADAEGNPVPGMAHGLAVDFQPGDGVRSTGFIEQQAGLYVAMVVSSKAGLFPAHVAFDGGAGRIPIAVGPGQNSTAHFIAPEPDLLNSHAETIGWLQPLTEDHIVIVRLRDARMSHVPGLAGELRIHAIEDRTGLTFGEFTETWDDGEQVYMARVSSAQAGQSIIGVSFRGHELPGTPIPVWWHDGVDVTRSHVETIGHTQPLGRDHTVIVRLHDSDGQPVEGRADGLRIEYVSNLTEMPEEAPTFAPGVIDGERVYVAKLSAGAVGQSIIAVMYDNGAGAAKIYGSPLPVWWHKSLDATLSVSKTTAKVVVETVEVTVEVRDTTRAPVTDVDDVVITSSLGRITDMESLGDGRFRATLDSDVEGVATVSFTSDAVAHAPTQDVEFHPVDAEVVPPTVTPGAGSTQAGPDAGPDAQLETTGADSIAWRLAAVGAFAAVVGAALMVLRRRSVPLD